MSGVSRTRGGSSRCDFVGVEPRLAPSPTPTERRPSQLAGINLALQALIDEVVVRERPYLVTEDAPPSLLSSCSPDPINCLDIGGTGERDVITVVFPWMMATVRCGIEITLSELKKELFEKLKKMEISQYSMIPTDYVFRGIRETTGEMEGLFNEEVSLSKLSLTVPFPMLFLYEPEGSRHEKELAKAIGSALGYPLEKMEEGLNDELKACRASLYNVTATAVMERGQGGYDHYAFPEEITLNVNKISPTQLMSKIKHDSDSDAGSLMYQVFYRTRSNEENNIDKGAIQVNIPFDAQLTPVLLIEKSLAAIEQREILEDENEEFLLQLAGQKSYLTRSDSYLLSYTGVRGVLEDYRMPRFVLRRKDIVLRDYPIPRPIHKPNYVRAQESRACDDDHHQLTGDDSSADFVSIWDLNENLKFRPLSCSNMGSTDNDAHVIFVDFYLYCGKTLLSHKTSGKVAKNNPRWIENALDSDVYMKDLPTASVLAVHLMESKMSKKTKQMEDNLLGWVNMRMTDWRDEVRQGTITLNLNKQSDNPVEFPPNGYVGIRDNRSGSIRLVIECLLGSSSSVRVKQPPKDRYEPFITEMIKWGKISPPNMDFSTKDKNDTKTQIIKDLLRKHVLGGCLSEEEEQLVWEHRYRVSRLIPDALIIICDSSILWKTRDNFVELYVLLSSWNPISVGASLTLLGIKSLDPRIREFAVQQLDKSLDSNTFPLFILPLLQALKSEPFAFSELACLLLRKALSDYRIGHKLFWLLRAELADIKEKVNGVEMSKILALLIEAYLRGNDDHIHTVVKQVEMVEFLSNMTVVAKGFKEKDVATRRIREELRDKCTIVENIDSPLDPTNALGELIIDKCKVLGSAKMPLRLSWRNVNPMSQYHLPTYEIIFKNGDDLRQDMLVLQVLEVMDNTWKKKDLDFCLSVYAVLPMGRMIGMIGVVPNCSTIFEIQSEGGKVGTAVKSLETTFINKYVRASAGNNTKEYLECVDRFFKSCVGYSVATFIMGIKDRHNDNIMMTRDGKLFHIDFGHILGHGKTKLGIQRDRVPFVLTEHFLCVIGLGKPVSMESHQVIKFKQACTKAYLLLWEHRHLYLSLFTLMQSMELGELSSDSDLDYIKKTLCVSDEDSRRAEKYFSEIFDEAFNGSWSTKTNWFFHTVKHL